MIVAGQEYWFGPGRTDADLARAVFATMRAIVSQQEALRSRWQLFVQLYLDREIDSKTDSGVGGTGFLELDPNDSLTSDIDDPDSWGGWNVCRAIPDAIIARVVMNPPQPKAVTEDAPEAVQRKADLIERFALASMRAARFYGGAMKRVARFGHVVGAAFSKILPDEITNDIRCGVYGPDRIVIDQKTVREGIGPTSVFHVDWLDRAELRAMFAKDKRALRVLEGTPTHKTYSGEVVHHDMIMVCDAWHAAIGRTPGRRVLCTSEGVLVDREHERKRLPFACYMPITPLGGGSYGESTIEPIVGVQKDINYALRELRWNLRTMGSRIFGVDDERQLKHYTLDRDTVLEGAGGQGGLNVITPPLAHTQIFEYLQMQYLKAGELTRTTELMRAAVPPRFESGAALQTWHDLNSEALVEALEALQDYVIDAAELTIEAGREIDARGGWSVRDVSRGVVDELKWSEVDPGRDRFIMSVQPASSLPNSPSGRLDAIERVIKSGMLPDPIEGLEHLGWADFSKLVTYRTAVLTDLKRTMEALIAGEPYEDHRPDALTQDLRRGIEIALEYHARHKWSRKASPEALSQLRQWISDAKAALAPDPGEESAEQSPDQIALGTEPAALMAPPAPPAEPSAGV
jgi:hypothetical protein